MNLSQPPWPLAPLAGGPIYRRKGGGGGSAGPDVPEVGLGPSIRVRVEKGGLRGSGRLRGVHIDSSRALRDVG